MAEDGIDPNVKDEFLGWVRETYGVEVAGHCRGLLDDIELTNGNFGECAHTALFSAIEEGAPELVDDAASAASDPLTSTAPHSLRVTGKRKDGYGPSR